MECESATGREFARRKMKNLIVVFLYLVCSATVVAQTPATQSSVPAPEQPKPLSVSLPLTGFAGLDQYRASRIAVYTDDYGQLARYRAANAALQAPAADDNRVVFFGDSITDIWKLDESFPGKPYVNRGIGGQTTSQMLVRFRQDVIDLRPKVVVILAGTNDIAGNSGPISNQDIESNFASIAELLCAAPDGENSGAKHVAEGVLFGEQAILPGLFSCSARRKRSAETR